MSNTATYTRRVRWIGDPSRHLAMGNGPEMDFSGPAGRAWVGGRAYARGCVCGRSEYVRDVDVHLGGRAVQIKLLSYECRGEGTKLIELDRTEIFSRLHLRPLIRVAAGGEAAAVVEARVRRALQSAQKYSLVANSVKSEVVVEPEIEIEEGEQP